MRPRTRGGTASTSAMSSANEHSPWRRAWSAAATAVWRVPVRARSTTVLAALVTRRSPSRTGSASRPTCGRTSDDPRPRPSVATSTRTASGHCSIRGRPHTAAAEVDREHRVLALQAQPGGVHEGGVAVLRCQATPLALGDPDTVAHLVPAAPGRLDAGGAQVAPTTQDACVERDRGCRTEHPATVPEAVVATDGVVHRPGDGRHPAVRARGVRSTLARSGGSRPIRVEYGPDAAKCS